VTLGVLAALTAATPDSAENPAINCSGGAILATDTFKTLFRLSVRRVCHHPTSISILDW
jgi:hypothetical protein